jgi:hypothetical protein
MGTVLKKNHAINLDSVAAKLESLLVSLESKKRSERFTEDLFSGFFRIKELGLASSRDDVPAINAPSGTWRPDGVVFDVGDTIFEIFELKKPKVKLCNGQAPNYPNSQVYFQAVRYIAGSHSFSSEREIKRVFCFNGQDLVCVSPVNMEQLRLFLNRAPWKNLKSEDDQEIERILKENSALIEAYFKFEYVASLPSFEMLSDKALFKHQVRHFCESLLRTIGIESTIVRTTVTKSNLKEIYTEFCRLVTENPEEHFVRIAPVWTRNNLFWFGKNGFLHVFQKDGSKVTDIPKADIRNKDLDAVKNLLESHVLDTPETFYDNYDTLLKPAVRKKLGSYFTKKGLAGFAQYFLSRYIGKYSDYYILDPAAGSGTLLAGLKAKSVFGTDIHEFKYSLMRERGVKHFSEPVDFLKTAPNAYVNQLNEATEGAVIDNPMIVLSNPPYLGHSSPDDLEETLRAEVKQFKIRSHDLCSYFMVQISRLFNGDYNGLGVDLNGYVAIFSPTTWISEDRGEQREFREYLLSQFSYEAGFKIDGSKFFDDMGQPVLFSVLKRRKKITWEKAELIIGSNKILDLTKDHKIISEIGMQWSNLPEIVKNGFESVETVIDPVSARRFNNNTNAIFSRRQDNALSTYVSRLPRFSKLLRTSSSQTGGNDLSLSSEVLKRGTKIEDICDDFKSKLHLRLSAEEMCKNLMVVYDDRSSGEAGYRFVYLDKNKFRRQAIAKVTGPALNYFEEMKKSHRLAKFYNAPPITTDIAVAQIPSEPLDLSLQQLRADGFKPIVKSSGEFKYLVRFQQEIGDARGLIFLRAFMSHLPAFKKLVSNKSIDSTLVWLPEISPQSIDALKELILISFCFSVSTTPLPELNLSFKKTSWKTEDYFSPLGWLKSSGLMKSLYDGLMKVASNEVRKACKDALASRLEKTEADAGTLIALGDSLFQRAGFIPAVAEKAIARKKS